MSAGVGVIAIAAAAVVGSASFSSSASAEEMMVERAKILKDIGVYGLFTTFKVRPSYYMLDAAERAMAADEVDALVMAHKDKVLVDAYLTRGFESESDFMLRLNAYEPLNSQAFLTEFAATRLGRNSDVTFSVFGVTKPLNHTTKEKSPDLLKALQETAYSAPDPKYAFMIPIAKDAEWWNMSEADKLKRMEEHTLPTLPFLVNVKRKLYHSTGIDDTDFITYFETADLVAFNDLNIALFSVPEMLNNTRYGRPTVMGAIMSVKDVVMALSK